MEEDIVQPEDLNLDEAQDSTPDESGDDEVSMKLKKAEEIAENQRIRAEKAEQQLKALKNKPAEKENSKKQGFDLKDIRALQDVPDEDVDDVTEYAKFKGISIAEAKKSPVVQTLLKTRAEERATAQAANTGVMRKGATKVSHETILNDFNNGVVSEKDEDVQKLVEAQLAARRARAKGN